MTKLLKNNNLLNEGENISKRRISCSSLNVLNSVNVSSTEGYRWTAFFILRCTLYLFIFIYLFKI